MNDKMLALKSVKYILKFMGLLWDTDTDTRCSLSYVRDDLITIIMVPFLCIFRIPFEYSADWNRGVFVIAGTTL